MTLNEQAILSNIIEHIPPEKPIVLAVSGGVDSMVLLSLFSGFGNKLPNPLSAIHINHGLSPNAEKWQYFVQVECEKLSIPFQCYRLSLSKGNRESLEEIARTARYDAIANLAPKNSIVLTAHHRHDQLETFILRLTRSAGLTGLGAMSEQSNYPTQLGQHKQIKLFRPFLHVNKNELVTHAKQNNVSWVEDESNNQTSFDRNYVRLNVIPTLEKRWPDMSKRVDVSAELLRQEKQLLLEYLQQDLESAVEVGFDGSNVLNLVSLSTYSEHRKSSLIREFFFKHCGYYPSRNILSQILRQMFTDNPNSQVCIAIGDYSLRRHRDYLYICQTVQEDLSYCELIVGNDPLYLPSSSLYGSVTLQTRCDELMPNDFVIRFGKLKTKAVFNQNGFNISVSNWLKTKGCPSWMRKHVPLVFYDDQLVAVANWVSLPFQYKITLSFV